MALRRTFAVLVAAVVLTACATADDGSDVAAPPSTDASTTSSTGPTPTVVPTSTPPPAPSAEPSPSPSRTPDPSASEPPAWYGERFLETTATGYPAPQEVPPEYVDRRLVTEDVLPPPSDDAFVGTSQPVPDDVLARSTWQPGCPVQPDELRYLQVSFWGFDGLPHTGELLVDAALADDVLAAFELLHEQRFPIERMVVPDMDDLEDHHNRGDDNTTVAFECRPVTGGDGWSWHAYGRAIDINPFHNPYVRDQPAGRVLLPAFAAAYLDRDRDVPGMINEGDPVVALFDDRGWDWGGRFNTLEDWQHFVKRP